MGIVRASEDSCNNAPRRQRLRQHVLVETEIRHQALQPRVLFLDLPEAPELTDAQMRILLLPGIERRLVDAHLATDMAGP